MMMTSDNTIETYKAIRKAVTDTLDQFLGEDDTADAVAVAALDAILTLCTLRGCDVDNLKSMRAAISSEIEMNDDGDEE
jgi:hypothetical protein